MASTDRDRRPGALAAERRASAPAQCSASRGFIADCPIDAAQKARLLTLYTDTRDVLAGRVRRKRAPAV